ncbi:Nitrosoguanidine and 6-azauracil resistance protein [Komagataella phaffii CBS 7435]|uniref:DNA Polymerase phi n=2 Tax=Komagataella phaffii TaxID=460519 RepID=C4R175_KOMPG|nr:DNA Polymerase phi [Komagataella phaffii GS115]AOA62826.1 GQ67_00670T0 [Komagataella phaffii]CAH2448224.1 Nitrosoguanidine and 6-azauracil resistance protein [Komagataella phaffii CBS 7435]AOA67416.1 GQ68_00718T0 [Komagataella phaffii GS115]CAY69249.1 DNA Polymerase phi [Komagataella phaffii GS115]CCA38359.1 Nitrosoguanidine and 6-azauracil resistance protein [Komagataella phaffii CBS 7435]
MKVIDRETNEKGSRSLGDDVMMTSNDSEAIRNDGMETSEAESFSPEKPLDTEELSLRHTKHSFFDSHLKATRADLGKKAIITLIILLLFMFSVFSIYWGSMYERNTRLVNLQFAVILEDDTENNYISNLVNETVHSGNFPRLATWNVFTHEQYLNGEDGDAYEKLETDIYHENYWAGIYVNNTATSQLIAAYQNGDSSFNTTATLLFTIYETGRDLTGISQYVLPTLLRLQEEVTIRTAEAVNRPIVENHISNVTQQEALIESGLLFKQLSFNTIDRRPSSSSVIQAPQQVGLIFMIIITFFQFAFFGPVHGAAAQVLKPSHYLVYRAIFSQVVYLFLSLAYSLITRAFQVDLNKAFSGGLGVYWMCNYLTMAAVGGANENVAIIATAFFPPLMAIWLMTWVILNISATFSPIILCPGVFKITYALPVYNSYSIARVVLFNTWKGNLGKHFGILVAWIVVNNVILPLVLTAAGKKMKKNSPATN